MERELAAIALSLGATQVRGWSADEQRLISGLPKVPTCRIRDIREKIRHGEDPLGELFCLIRSPEIRRPAGATYTPKKIISAMIAWAASYAQPSRIVDPGAGSGRFLVAAGRKFKNSDLVGIELDPLAALIARGHVAAAGLHHRAQIILTDYRRALLPPISGRTLYIGNPPYVRHHLLGTRWKNWLSVESKRLRLTASQLAGLHVHFFLATTLAARPRDFGAFITAAEWLDVNYGKLVRDLFTGALGGQNLVVIEPTALPFPDAATTGVITCFEKSSRPARIKVWRVKSLGRLGKLNGGQPLRRERLESESRWSHLTRRANKPPSGFIELGELCRVHRGQVTGSNSAWIVNEQSNHLPDSVKLATVTRAKELYAAGSALDDTTSLRRVIDLPMDLDELDERDRKEILQFLRRLRKLGVHQGYVAQNRKAWWSVGLKDPAPILATYMSRRPPAFVRNLVSARHINIAHGIYPRDKMDEKTMGRLVRFLSRNICLKDGRTYAGGLTKFEPREMERLVVPGPELLRGAQPEW
ncbi:MAG: SAM-dependent methyltransferase [Elusimicrobia bacterium CG_4_9_14_3_um_filter_62_55]|nr:MAG: SAM-dependent methyltransferase [Elusimicrobia bacterium CG22_combo_CG10-13_8_21_14_all_63_91]PJA17580.1 MAG: SAM-dependent methyltransferase [Elusimicrobia bacterium CG_4_10_14_0_2_um_filter_63_34]PJB24962.1 MAG: SAM-dependent methyltransferase [Elusimicrobia bacterium CG_4_9_14_3_um_filter_62_55]